MTDTDFYFLSDLLSKGHHIYFVTNEPEDVAYSIRLTRINLYNTKEANKHNGQLVMMRFSSNVTLNYATCVDLDIYKDFLIEKIPILNKQDVEELYTDYLLEGR